MFGATFLVPVLTGFPVSTTLLFSGVGTILFLLITRNKLPSYLGSSFAFIAPVTAATATAGTGSALAGIVAVGVLLAAIGFVVQFAGMGWIDRLMPPVVAGAIVALIGFNLAPVAWSNFQQQPLTGSITLAAVILFSVFFRGFLGRISIVLGVVVGYIVAVDSPARSTTRPSTRPPGSACRSSSSPTSSRPVRGASSRCSCPSCWCSSPRTSATSAASPR